MRPATSPAIPAQTRLAPRRKPRSNGVARQEGALPPTISRPQLLEDGSDDAFRGLVHALFAFAARHQAIREGHAHYIGLAGVEYTVLISIARLGREELVNVKTVADHLYVSGAFITTVTRRLQAAGLVEKLPDKVDRRRVFLRVTRAGLDRLRRLAPHQREVNDLEFACLTATEFRALGAIMQRLIPCADQALALQELRRLAVPAFPEASSPHLRKRAI